MMTLGKYILQRKPSNLDFACPATILASSPRASEKSSWCSVSSTPANLLAVATADFIGKHSVTHPTASPDNPITAETSAVCSPFTLRQGLLTRISVPSIVEKTFLTPAMNGFMWRTSIKTLPLQSRGQPLNLSSSESRLDSLRV